MFVLCALISPDQIRRLELHDPSSFANNIRDDNVTGRLNIVNRPPDRCAVHPLIVQVHNTKSGLPLRLWDATNEWPVQVLGKEQVKNAARGG
jgi:hypothetical protein